MALRGGGARVALAAILVGAFAASASPAAARPHACPPGKPPDWAQTSDSGGYGEYYPVGAGLPPGEVTLSCVAAPGGKLEDCQVVDEKPEDQGLGLWALHVARDLRLKRPGCPPDGARFTVPLRFERAG
jgi:hypothetical protein